MKANTEFSDLTDWLALKREGSASCEPALGDEGDACYQRDARNRSKFNQIIQKYSRANTDGADGTDG